METTRAALFQHLMPSQHMEMIIRTESASWGWSWDEHSTSWTAVWTTLPPELVIARAAKVVGPGVPVAARKLIGPPLNFANATLINFDKTFS